MNVKLEREKITPGLGRTLCSYVVDSLIPLLHGLAAGSESPHMVTMQAVVLLTSSLACVICACRIAAYDLEEINPCYHLPEVLLVRPTLGRWHVDTCQ